MQEISLDELFGHLDKLGESEVVLDVRRPDEYEAGHIKGSLNIAHDEVGDFAEKLKAYSKIFIHCKAGGRARTAFNTLEALGFNNVVCIADAGFDEWVNRGYPVEK